MAVDGFPELSREELAGFSSWSVLRAASALVRDGAVQSVHWEQPVLSGTVREDGEEWQAELDLRSTTFVRNRCGCRDGQSGRVCAHALALCLAWQRQPARPAPAAPPRSGSLLPDNWLVVDGSPQFLSILLKERDHPQHARCREFLRAEGFRHEPSNGKWWLRDSHKVLNFLARHRARLEADYDVGYTANFLQRMAPVRPATLTCETQAHGRGYTIRAELKGDGLEPGEIRNALVANRHYIQKAGRILLLEDGLLEQFQILSRSLGGQPEAPLTGVFEGHLSAAELAPAEALFEEEGIQLELPPDWTERSAAIRQVGKLQPPPLKPEVGDRFRAYQLVGTAWMWHLYRHRLGGILADEMGLGKTIQAIGLMLCWKAAGNPEGPILVVAPASLLGNWHREISQWAPGLKVYRHHGPDRLNAFWPEEAVPDICLTSYSTLRNDRDCFEAAPFSLAIADEAQHVKNRRTHAARALRSVRSGPRFVLTGTPIENAIEDLRALFDFCLPGFLKRPPAEVRGEDREALDRRDLKRAAPYILRRSKTLVAPELPDKIEQAVWCTLEGDQARLYEAVKTRTSRALIDLAASGASESRLRFALLTELLRLRQVCADPGLLEPDFPLEHSAKFQAFRELLEEAMDGGHRLLVFSQFVKLLKRLREWLQEAGIPSAYIDGSTPDRLAVCDRFNRQPEIPLCLISLKAGGTGLNLTGADMVVHFDPWWNPAVEDQATDRAHRIGQVRQVTSCKLVTEGTVEEKVRALQAAKAELLRDLLDASSLETAKVDLETLKALVS